MALLSPRYGAASPQWMRISRVLGPLFFALGSIPAGFAAPLLRVAKEEAHPAEDASLWVYLGTAVALVLLGGVFAGLTIALMGQDEIYLQVLAQSGEGAERRNAKKVLKLLNRGKHWVLVTLLLGNVITNETLPIVLDRSLGGGWPAVLGSTVLIVIFGEIAPQSVCVRYGLPIGAWMAPFVLVLMYLLSPIAWPTAKLLDYLLGEDHGTTYKKAGLKTLVTLHRTLGDGTERLNQDEVTIISAVLDLKDKPVGNIMTPISDVFTLSLDTVLDEAMMDKILAEGYSRIPIYAVHNPRDFVGMLLVKMLITYDPEDSLRVRDFQLATLPETRRDTSCLDIVNFFQEGKSHMVLVSDYPGEPRGALGVLTLEDVIEELIGEEIVDESDVYVDVHKAIRRIKPAPFARIRKAEKGEVVTDPDPQVPDSELEGDMDAGRRSRAGSRASSRAGSYVEPRKTALSMSRSPTAKNTYFRRRSSTGEPTAIRSDAPEMRQHLRQHLEPSNLASRPKATRIGTVKIKPGVGQLSALPEAQPVAFEAPAGPTRTQSAMTQIEDPTETTGLLSGGRNASDGTHALNHAISYGAMSDSSTAKTKDMPIPPLATTNAVPSPALHQSLTQEQEPIAISRPSTSSAQSRSSHPRNSMINTPPKMVLDLMSSRENLNELTRETSDDKGKEPAHPTYPTHSPSKRGRSSSQDSTSTLGSLRSVSSQRHRKRGARSGSITEHVLEVGGVKKIVLETTSSSDDEEGRKNGDKGVKLNGNGTGLDGAADQEPEAEKGKKKKRKKRGGKKVRAREEGAGI